MHALPPMTRGWWGTPQGYPKGTPLDNFRSKHGYPCKTWLELKSMKRCIKWWGFWGSCYACCATHDTWVGRGLLEAPLPPPPTILSLPSPHFGRFKWAFWSTTPIFPHPLAW